MNLTPGDFAAVIRRLRALGDHPSPARLLGELQLELRVKESAPERIGF